MVTFFDDLVVERGVSTVWRICSLDLLVTVPRYRLEQLVNEHRTTATIHVLVLGFAAAGALSVLTGVYPGVLLLAAALVLALSQRSALARSLRTPSSQLRRRRLRVAAVLGAAFVADYVSYLALIGDKWTLRETVLAVSGMVCLIAALGFLVAGLLTPRSALVSHPA